MQACALAILATLVLSIGCAVEGKKSTPPVNKIAIVQGIYYNFSREGPAAFIKAAAGNAKIVSPMPGGGPTWKGLANIERYFQVFLSTDRVDNLNFKALFQDTVSGNVVAILDVIGGVYSTGKNFTIPAVQIWTINKGGRWTEFRELYDAVDFKKYSIP